VLIVAVTLRNTTLAEALAREGYLTAVFVANQTVLAPRMGLDQGFDTWVRFRAPGAVLNQEIFSWLDVAGKSERPFFLFVNYMDTHRPYNTRPRPGLGPACAALPARARCGSGDRRELLQPRA
jgi:hypothetical protein